MTIEINNSELLKRSGGLGQTHRPLPLTETVADQSEITDAEPSLDELIEALLNPTIPEVDAQELELPVADIPGVDAATRRLVALHPDLLDETPAEPLENY